MPAAWGPMGPGDEWAGWSLSVPSISLLTSKHSVFEYKLPYSVPSATCCTRIHPMLYCCDVYCCRCFNVKGAQPGLPFIDLVNQEDGHQIRYRMKKACCRVPQILAFMDGQFLGQASRTMRCGNRCLVCMEDFWGKDVLQVGLHNDMGDQVARIDRNGRGKCCFMDCAFPMKCTGCCFTCAMCTLKCMPGKVEPCFGCCDCDPVCCDCCVKGDIPLFECLDTPCCCIGLPCCTPTIWCPCPACETKNFESVGTIMYRDFEVIDSSSKAVVGQMQTQYRGNYPSAYTHAGHTAFKVNGNTTSGTLGTLLSAVAAGMVFPMGAAMPTFGLLTAKPEGTSPDYTGWVQGIYADQIKKLVGIDCDAAMREDLIVTEDMIFGTKIEGVQTKGWQLHEFGYSSGGLRLCGMVMGAQEKKPKSVSTLEEVKNMVKIALESQLGNYGTTFWMRFKLPDQEKQIVKKGANIFGDLEGISSKFNPPGGGFVDQMEEVALACNCIRVCRFPANCTQDKTICCRCPCYARVVSSAKVAPAAWADPPPSVVMVGTPKSAFVERSPSNPKSP